MTEPSAAEPRAKTGLFRSIIGRTRGENGPEVRSRALSLVRSGMMVVSKHALVTFRRVAVRFGARSRESKVPKC